MFEVLRRTFVVFESGQSKVIRLGCGAVRLKKVEAAAVSIFSLARVPFELVGITQSRHPRRQRREDARPAEFVREKSGHREAKIAHDLRFHPKPVLARQQLVGGIDLAKLLAMGGRLLISRGRHNRFDHLLTTPSQPPVIVGKPIEQLRVDWTLTSHPKIVHGAHQPLTEQFVPEVIRQTRGGNGLSSETNQLAKSSRSNFPSFRPSIGGKTARPPGFTSTLVGLRKFPRSRIFVAGRTAFGDHPHPRAWTLRHLLLCLVLLGEESLRLFVYIPEKVIKQHFLLLVVSIFRL